jgi:hypothetical protein
MNHALCSDIELRVCANTTRNSATLTEQPALLPAANTVGLSLRRNRLSVCLILLSPYSLLLQFRYVVPSGMNCHLAEYLALYDGW